MKRFLVRADDLLHLIEERDAWAGSFDPSAAEEWLEDFADLRKKCEKAVAEAEKETCHESKNQ